MGLPASGPSSAQPVTAYRAGLGPAHDSFRKACKGPSRSLLPSPSHPSCQPNWILCHCPKRITASHSPEISPFQFGHVNILAIPLPVCSHNPQRDSFLLNPKSSFMPAMLTRICSGLLSLCVEPHGGPASLQAHSVVLVTYFLPSPGL